MRVKRVKGGSYGWSRTVEGTAISMDGNPKYMTSSYLVRWDDGGYFSVPCYSITVMPAIATIMNLTKPLILENNYERRVR